MLRFNWTLRLAAGKPLSSNVNHVRTKVETQCTTQALQSSLILYFDDQLITSAVTPGKPLSHVLVPMFFPPFIPTSSSTRSSSSSQNVPHFFPLDLALRFPLNGAQQGDISAFQEKLTAVLRNENAIPKDLENSEEVKMTIRKMMTALPKMMSQHSLASRRLLLFQNASQLSALHPSREPILNLAWSCPQIEHSLRQDAKTAIWCNTFADWYVNRSTTRYIALHQNSKNTSSSQQPKSPNDALRQYVGTVAAAKQKNCLASLTQKLDSMIATSQMSHVGLCVKDSRYFDEQKRLLENKRQEALDIIKNEFRKYLPAESSSRTLQKVNELSPQSTNEGTLREFIIGETRDTAYVARPLNLCHGWYATCFYLRMIYRLWSRCRQEDQEKLDAITIPGTNRETLQYSLNYFGVCGLFDEVEETGDQLHRAPDSPFMIKRLLKHAQSDSSSSSDESSINTQKRRKEFQLVFDSPDLFPDQLPHIRKELTRSAVEKFGEGSNNADVEFVKSYFSQDQDDVGIVLADDVDVAFTEDLVIDEFYRKKVEENRTRAVKDGENKVKDVDEDEDDGDGNSGVSCFHNHDVKIQSKYLEKLQNGKNSSSYFNVLLFCRLILPEVGSEPLRVEVLSVRHDNEEQQRSSKPVVFDLSQIEAFQNFVRDASSAENDNNKLNVLICMKDAVIAQDVLRLSLLQQQEQEVNENNENAIFDWCFVDFTAIVGNLQRIAAENGAFSETIRDVLSTNIEEEATSTTETNENKKQNVTNKKLTEDDTGDEDFVVFDDEELSETTKHNLFDVPEHQSDGNKFVSSTSDDDESAPANNKKRSRPLSSVEKMKETIEGFITADDSPLKLLFSSSKQLLFSDCRDQSQSSKLTTAILVSAGNALTSAPHFDPFVSCCSLELQQQAPFLTSSSSQSSKTTTTMLNKRDLLLDHLPLDSPLRAQLITVYHSDTPTGEALTRANSPISDGCRKLEDLGQCASDLKMMSRFVSNPKNSAEISPPHLQQQDRFMYAQIKHSQAATGRLSAVQPNIFAISKLPQVRGAFQSRFKNGWMMEADYSQMEVIVLAVLSGDAQMQRDLKNQINFHNKRVTFLKPLLTYNDVVTRLKAGDEEIANLRRIAKIFTFQRQYGAGAVAISHSTGLDLRTVNSLIRQEQAAYPGVEGYFSNIARQLYRKRTDRKEVDFQLPSGTLIPFEESDAVSGVPSPRVRNYPVQGFAADLMQYALAELWRRLRAKNDKALIVNVVHDSVWLDVEEDAVAETAAVVKSVLENVGLHTLKNVGLDLGDSVKFKVDLQVGRTLAEMKDYYKK